MQETFAHTSIAPDHAAKEHLLARRDGLRYRCIPLSQPLSMKSTPRLVIVLATLVAASRSRQVAAFFVFEQN